MPKLIENLEEKLVAETKHQLESGGYGALTVRGVANACGVGVGTVYNYFPSKEALVAAYMLQEWRPCIRQICDVAEAAWDPRPVVRCIYDCLQTFAAEHSAVLDDPAATLPFAQVFRRYHGLLRRQLAQPLAPFCPDDFTARFAAESLLTWSMAGIPFAELYPVVEKLFVK
ncbi:MAG: TetR/AcrR family transcriptional regulator [Clostridia bacterium]|nr:TetR/AcrR family transcriptional regulator [Clostridia bacterium]